MVAIGLICAFFILRADFARRGTPADAEAIIGITGLSGLAGSRLYHLLETPADFFADPWPQLFSTMGFAFFGAVIGGFLALLYLARRFKMPALLMLDAASPAGALGYGIGRIGCLISGDGDYGIPTSLPWGMSFPNGIVPTTERVHPTPIYEFLSCVLIAAILWRMSTKAMDNGGSHGEIISAYLILTGIARFLVEFIRINPKVLYGLTNAQIVSLLSIVLGLGLLWQIKRGQALKSETA